jgi:ribosome-associated toxin RatA of RatAB toxin-antitoxin module
VNNPSGGGVFGTVDSLGKIVQELWSKGSTVAMKRSRILTAYALMLALAGVPAAAQAGGVIGDVLVTPELQQGRIPTSGRAQPGTKVQRGRAMILIDAPADRVYEVIQNYAAYKEFLPHFETSRVLSKRGASALIYVQVKIMKGAKTIWAELKMKPREKDGATRVIEAKMMKGNVDHFEAHWEVTPIDDKRTLVAFEIIVDPDLPLPSSFVSEENVKSARKTLRALRERVTGVKPAKT